MSHSSPIQWGIDSRAKTEDVEGMWAELEDLKLDESKAWRTASSEAWRVAGHIYDAESEVCETDEGLLDKEREITKTERVAEAIRLPASPSTDWFKCLFTVSFSKQESLLVRVSHYWESPHCLSNLRGIPIVSASNCKCPFQLRMWIYFQHQAAVCRFFKYLYFTYHYVIIQDFLSRHRPRPICLQSLS